MPTRMALIRTCRGASIVLALVVLAGCSPAIAPSAATSGAKASPAPETSEPTPTLAGLDAPPEATLAAEGGDPVMGQLGTYTWLDSGNDSPWLPGAPIAVGAGESLTVAFVPPGDIDTWQARYVPAAAGDPFGAVALGNGSGDPAFAAPRAGSWTVEVFVEYAAGAGDARYFWRLDVE